MVLLLVIVIVFLVCFCILIHALVIVVFIFVFLFDELFRILHIEFSLFFGVVIDTHILNVYLFLSSFVQIAPKP